jgi:hypothetical protein
VSSMSPDAAAIAALARRVAREPGDGEPRPPIASDAELDVREFGGRIHGYAGGAINPLIEVRGVEESLLVPLAALEEWFRADRGPHNTSVSLRVADEVAKTRGAVAVISLGWSSGGTLEIRRGGRRLGVFFRRIRYRLGFY